VTSASRLVRKAEHATEHSLAVVVVQESLCVVDEVSEDVDGSVLSSSSLSSSSSFSLSSPLECSVSVFGGVEHGLKGSGMQGNWKVGNPGQLKTTLGGGGKFHTTTPTPLEPQSGHQIAGTIVELSDPG